jgi:uncharacterized protein (UPF0210 family)
MENKIIRSICLFRADPDTTADAKIESVKSKLINFGYEVQTTRLLVKNTSIIRLEKSTSPDLRLSVGRLDYEQARSSMNEFLNSNRTSFNTDLTNVEIDEKYINILLEIIRRQASKTFNFAYTFNNSLSSPFFPSATYERNGFSIGLQSTNLSHRSENLAQWFSNMKSSWEEINGIFKDDIEFIGIDSSIAPLYNDTSSLINLIKRLGLTFNQSVLSDIYTQMTQYIKSYNPKPVGLCGLMLPCLEDFELADEYTAGNFDIKTNLFLSLHSGLGIDTFPIGIDEKPEDIMSILKLTKALSLKYAKPLSVRFVSDGKAKIGDKTDFQNNYLKDVVIRPLILK